MQADMASLVVILVGAAVVFIDGRLIWRSGATYLEEVYSDSKVADSVNRLVAVLFHLVVLGLLAMISVTSSANTVESVVLRIGVVLLVTALAHGITILVLTRIRRKQRQQRIQEEIAVQTQKAAGPIDEP
ncbi:hypothetical protein [Saccharopolyspora sp. CA-218241]|uniref:hypothetical protein n=1 Tax=Saccharopolyspora sp. CA-218241 TaxID=3240027 RepID=UPI003D95DC05